MANFSMILSKTGDKSSGFSIKKLPLELVCLQQQVKTYSVFRFMTSYFQKYSSRCNFEHPNFCTCRVHENLDFEANNRLTKPPTNRDDIHKEHVKILNFKLNCCLVIGKGVFEL